MKISLILNVSITGIILLLSLIEIILINTITASHAHYYNSSISRGSSSSSRRRRSNNNNNNNNNNDNGNNSSNSNSDISSESYDIWTFPRDTNNSMYISVSPVGFQNLTNYLHHWNISYEIIVSNLQRAILDEKRDNHLRRVSSYLRTGRNRPYYKSFNEIVQYLDQLSQTRPYMTVEDFGYTAEGRPMKGVTISSDSTRPIIWIDAGIHAREWIAPATALSIINKLMRPSGQTLLKHFQFFIVPVVNPDGYEYTRTKYRLWRKNRARAEGEACIGIDLNRNFPFKWGVGNGASPHSCSDTYRGIEAASELETQSIIKKLKSLQKQIILYLSLHSFGQYILTPFGFSRYSYPPYYQKLVSLHNSSLC
ncbi:unnamed protein product [Schistosoma margrebowiei]|uniref:Peptidase M14 domain-containing protein n=1 Tax=Schistosoma margrebowiei TaxID=48269 RepID=A0A183LUX6_9TREM|nr:unnamed protein product [Schistosoma margrebowiei]